ncbi:MAG: hypothetical protein WBP93_21950 [Pyrinomonadaceae bacterium]
MQDEKQPKSLEELIALTKEVIASGELSEEERADLEERCREIEQMPKEERDSMNYFLQHMPYGESDLTLIVLKGHLLIEQKIREFIRERMLTPTALDMARLNAHQAICLAEALTLPNEEPKNLWSVIRKVNSLRNQLAHKLEPQDIERRVKEIESDYSTFGAIQSGFAGILGHLYSQLSELCRIARDPSFQVRRKGSSQ